MPEVLDRGGGEDEARKEAAKQASESIGKQHGVSAAERWAYWQYLRNWRRCGKRGRRWSVRDVAVAHTQLARAIEEGDEKKAEGLRKFLDMDGCEEPLRDGERPSDCTEDHVPRESGA